jgi:hypothetical protein
MIRKIFGPALFMVSISIAAYLIVLGIKWESSRPREVDKIEIRMPQHVSRLRVEKISDEIEKSGLYSLTLDDTVNVLLYKEQNASTLIQIK